MGKGAAGYLVKTIPKGELLARIEKIFSERQSREIIQEILILDNDVEHLKSMRAILTEQNYKVRVVRTSMEAVDHIRNHHPNLFIIGRDSSGVSPQEVYESLDKIMEENFFSPELIDRVKAALATEN